jgi:hypothetical protein
MLFNALLCACQADWRAMQPQNMDKNNNQLYQLMHSADNAHWLDWLSRDGILLPLHLLLVIKNECLRFDDATASVLDLFYKS